MANECEYKKVSNGALAMLASTTSVNCRNWLPSFTVWFRDPCLGFTVVGNLQLLRVPQQFFLWKAYGDRPEQDCFGKRSCVIECEWSVLRPVMHRPMNIVIKSGKVLYLSCGNLASGNSFGIATLRDNHRPLLSDDG